MSNNPATTAISQPPLPVAATKEKTIRIILAAKSDKAKDKKKEKENQFPWCGVKDLAFVETVKKNKGHIKTKMSKKDKFVLTAAQLAEMPRFKSVLCFGIKNTGEFDHLQTNQLFCTICLVFWVCHQCHLVQQLSCGIQQSARAESFLIF